MCVFVCVWSGLVFAWVDGIVMGSLFFVLDDLMKVESGVCLRLALRVSGRPGWMGRQWMAGYGMDGWDGIGWMDGTEWMEPDGLGE